MGKFVVTGKKPFFGPDCKTYQPGDVVEIPDFREVKDDAGNVRMVGMRPGKYLKPYAKNEKKAAGTVPEAKSGTGRKTA